MLAPIQIIPDPITTFAAIRGVRLPIHALMPVQRELVTSALLVKIVMLIFLVQQIDQPLLRYNLQHQYSTSTVVLVRKMPQKIAGSRVGMMMIVVLGRHAMREYLLAHIQIILGLTDTFVVQVSAVIFHYLLLALQKTLNFNYYISTSNLGRLL